MSSLQNRHIVVGVSAGIAAYKSPDLVRRLRERGASVRVVMSRNAEDFITPLTLQAVSGHPVHLHQMDADSENGMGHIELARWADAVVIAPATANLVARLVQGMADELLTTVCLATEAPVAVAPAMNQQMWQNEATIENMRQLESRGIAVLGPGTGDQACGETGPGRMLEPLQIADKIESLFSSTALSGLNLMLTAGPTWEALDPVRGLTNHSSGHMGFALARAAVDAGARVTLIAGPTALARPEDVDFVDVVSAREMHEAVMSRIHDQHVFIGVAAVADYRPENESPDKIKKQADSLMLQLVRNPDIIADVAALDDAPFTVGFAAETGDLVEHARGKLEKKGLDLVAANRIGGSQAGFGNEPHSVTLIGPDLETELPAASKDQLARTLVAEIGRYYREVRGSVDETNVTPLNPWPDTASR